MLNWLSKLRSRGVTFRAAILAAAVLVSWAVTAIVTASLGGGAQAVEAAILAAILCWAGAAAALLINHLMPEPHQAMAGLLMGTAVRMGTPLLPAVLMHLQGSPLAEGGLLYYLLVFYPITLAVETALSLPYQRRQIPAQEVPSNAAS